MTSDEFKFSDNAPLEYPITIYTTDGTPIPVSHKGIFSSPCLSLSDTFHISKLSLNLLYVGQLCELGIDLLFSWYGCAGSPDGLSAWDRPKGWSHV